MQSLPHVFHIEQSVIGATLIDKRAAERIIETIGQIDKESTPFFDRRHSIIYKTVCDLTIKGEEADLGTVTDLLRKRKWLQDAGGPHYLIELTSNIITTVNVEAHSRLILEKYAMRKMIWVAEEIKNKAYADDEDTFDYLDWAEGEVFKLSEMRHKKGALSLGALSYGAIDHLSEIEARIKLNDSYVTGITSGLSDLDYITNGWQKTDLIVLGARPSMGKSMCMLKFAMSAALNPNKARRSPVAIFSLEMGAQQLVYRLLCSCANVDASAGKKGRWTSDEWKRVSMAIEDFQEAKIYIDDTAAITPLELRAKCRKLKAQHKIELVIVDYLQLMTVGGRRMESREREISEISSALKGLAKELEIPVIALAQLNRELEKRTNKRPMLSDLRESGSVEANADIVLFLYRPEKYGIAEWEDGKPTENTVEIITAKHRNGETGSSRVAMFTNTGRFEDLLFIPEFEEFISPTSQ